MNRVSPFRKGIVRVTTAPAVSPQPKPPMRRANLLPRPVAPGSGLLLARRHGWNLRSGGAALQPPLGCGSHTWCGVAWGWCVGAGFAASSGWNYGRPVRRGKDAERAVAAMPVPPREFGRAPIAPRDVPQPNSPRPCRAGGVASPLSGPAAGWSNGGHLERGGVVPGTDRHALRAASRRQTSPSPLQVPAVKNRICPRSPRNQRSRPRGMDAGNSAQTRQGRSEASAPNSANGIRRGAIRGTVAPAPDAATRPKNQKSRGTSTPASSTIATSRARFSFWGSWLSP